MIQTIKHGDRNPLTFFCPSCGCKFQASGKDLHLDSDKDGLFYMAVCPGCYKRVRQKIADYHHSLF